jgi:hypothetical protein
MLPLEEHNNSLATDLRAKNIDEMPVKELKRIHRWWCTPVILALDRQKFTDTLHYRARLFQTNKQTKINNQTKVIQKNSIRRYNQIQENTERQSSDIREEIDT